MRRASTVVAGGADGGKIPKEGDSVALRSGGYVACRLPIPSNGSNGGNGTNGTNGTKGGYGEGSGRAPMCARYNSILHHTYT